MPLEELAMSVPCSSVPSCRVCTPTPVEGTRGDKFEGTPLCTLLRPAKGLYEGQSLQEWVYETTKTCCWSSKSISAHSLLPNSVNSAFFSVLLCAVLTMTDALFWGEGVGQIDGKADELDHLD